MKLPRNISGAKPNKMQSAGLKPYPKYKDSGVEWLGDVPAHWEIFRFKAFVENVAEQTATRSSDEMYIALENVESWTGRIQGVESDATFDSQAKRFQPGDVLFGKLRPYLAKVTRPTQNGVCVSEFLVLRPKNKKLLPAYLEQLIRSKPTIDAISASTFGAKMPRADWNFIGGMEKYLPPLPEQTAIVRYLDYVDRRIQQLVRVKEKLIDLLNEQKPAVIHQVVTGKVDVRTGQPYPAYKPSGVEWLGEVPVHWETRQLGDSIIGCVNGVWGSDPDGVNDLPCVRVADFDRQQLRVRKPIPTMRSIVNNERRKRMLQSGDLLLEKSGGGDQQPVGVVILFDHDSSAVCSNFIARMPVRKGFDPTFLTFLHSMLYSLRLNTRSIKQTTGIQNLDSAAYLSEPVAFPPLSEQTAIVKHLDKTTADIDTAITRARREIELVNEYRTRLIADVVTGKLDVREAAAQLPDATEESLH